MSGPRQLRWELFATGRATPDATWAVVGDLRRLPEWTDAVAVDVHDVDPLAPAVADGFVTVDPDRTLRWRVTTVERRLLEATADTPCGRLGIGLRVAPDPRGTRLVLAGGLTVDGRAARWRARTVEVPAMRGRFDRWTEAALRLGAAAEDV